MSKLSILYDYLRKRKLTESELTTEEKAQFDSWKRTLSEGEITVSKVAEFCSRMVDTIEAKWRDFEYKDKERLLPYHTAYRALLGVINGPQVEREQLEKYLNQILEA